MKNEKVYIEGYVVGSFADTLGNRGKQIQLINGDIVDIDDNFIYKSIEPEKVKIPQFVADWIEWCKRKLSIRQAISQVHVSNEVDDWLMEVDADGAFVNQETFARAWLDGYEVEEEKRYLVKIKATKHYFVKDGNGKIFFSLAFKGCFTKKELEEAGFGWVFDCPGFEIEEVE